MTRQDYTVLFENEEGKHYIPVETCGAINIYSNVILGSSFFEFAKRNGLVINIFGKYGDYVGSFYSTSNKESAQIILRQAEIYHNKKRRLEIAQKIELASLHNQRENLRYYYKHKKQSKLKDAIDYMTRCMEEIKSAEDITRVMLAEARGKQKYLQCFDIMLDDEDFVFEKRTRRPPLNEVNALLSFGNTFLYQRISTEIRKTSLDIRIGFVHATNNRHETLNLDIAEIFKPIIVDRAIFTIVHNREITVEHFEKNESGGTMLNKIGKRIFIEELEKKLNQKLKVGDVQRTYDFLIRNEIQKIARTVKYDEKYKPYKYT